MPVLIDVDSTACKRRRGMQERRNEKEGRGAREREERDEERCGIMETRYQKHP